MTGSKRWPTTAWRELLSLALPALDEVGANFVWTFGGGTALALRLGHRVSYDVDIFIEDAAVLRMLSPNRNTASRGITDLWQEPGNYIKLEHRVGAIDFILAGKLTALPPWVYRFEGRDILVEEPAEILAKKLKYRGSRFLPRDIFDLLAIHQQDPTQVQHAVAAEPDGARRARDRIQRIAKRYRETIHEEVNPTATGLVLLSADPLDAAALLGPGEG